MMRLHEVVLSVAFVLLSSPLRAASYYVDPVKGSDAAPGTSVSRAFRTLQKAADSTQPGDTVYALGGNYTDTVHGDVVTIRRSGTASAPIAYSNYHGQRANVVLSDNNWLGIHVAPGTKYIVIDGFEVTGTNQHLTWAGANAARESGLSNPRYNGAGIDCSSQGYQPTSGVAGLVSHIVVENCRIHDCAQQGIGSGGSDYVTFRNNTIWNCSWYSSYDGSGITTGDNSNSDDNTTTYKIVIEGNTIYNCRAEIGFEGSRWDTTDGNGIIIDGDGAVNGLSAYKGKILIANNLVYGCGGRGITVNKAHNVDIVNNTLYHNAGEHSVANTLIQAGGPGAAPFAADTGFKGGSVDTPWTGAVDSSTVTRVTAAPLAVYQSERQGLSSPVPSGFTYTIKERPVNSYRIILLFTEDRWNAPSARQFDVSVNGQPWLTNFDIYAVAGAMHKAVVQECRDTADPDGKIVIRFTPGKFDVPKVDGIEILNDYITPNGEIYIGSGRSAKSSYHIANNVICPLPGHQAIEHYGGDPADVTCTSNLYYGGSGSHPETAFTGDNALWSDPQFAAAGLSATADFHLRDGSPAIGTGDWNIEPYVLWDGIMPPNGKIRIRGCF